MCGPCDDELFYPSGDRIGDWEGAPETNEKEFEMLKWSRVLFVGWVLLLAPVVFAGDVIVNGIDTWTTPGGGWSFLDFGDDPIPAGFFCSRSEPFAGRILWQGEPLVTQPAGALSGADTVVQRLDDASFDADGRAFTRLQMRALSLASIKPVRTACGTYDVKASLNGIQPIRGMDLYEKDKENGYFVAHMLINVKLIFTPVDPAGGRSLVLERNDITVESSQIPWTSSLSESELDGQIGGFVLVDTDGDRVADTYLPGQSNFHPKRDGSQTDSLQYCLLEIPEEGEIPPPGTYCHVANGDCHCVYP